MIKRMSALQAVVRPDGLEAIVGADDAAWLAAEARKAKERVERYDGVDGAAGLFGEDASDGEGGVCEGGDGWTEWLDLFFVADAVQWPSAPQLKYHSSIGAIGHGDVVWAAGEELARRILAHEAPFEAVGMGTRVLEMGAGCGLPSLAAAHGGADVVATDAPVAGGIVALAATARRMGPTFDGRLRVRRLDWGDAAREGPFDVVLMADIIYAPTAHEKLLATLRGVFEANPKAVAVVAFCLHGNAPDDKVMAFFDRARERGLEATEVDVVQRGASESMRGVIMATDPKRARVHTWVLRLS